MWVKMKDIMDMLWCKNPIVIKMVSLIRNLKFVGVNNCSYICRSTQWSTSSSENFSDQTGKMEGGCFSLLHVCNISCCCSLFASLLVYGITTHWALGATVLQHAQLQPCKRAYNKCCISLSRKQVWDAMVALMERGRLLQQQHVHKSHASE